MDLKDTLKAYIKKEKVNNEAFDKALLNHAISQSIDPILFPVYGIKEYKPYYVSSDFLDAVSEYDFRGGLIGDKSNTVVFDNTKLKRAVPDFVPHVRAEEGIRIAIENIMLHPELQILDKDFDEWCDKVIAELEEAKKRILA